MTSVFFLIVNSAYFWEPVLGSWAMLAIMLLFVFYVILAGIFLKHLVLVIKGKFSDKQRVIAAALLLVVLLSALLRPAGIIDFDRLAGEDLLIAKREGAANCMTVLRLKDNYTFVEKSVCFGISQVKGSWEIKGDTILFSNIQPNRHTKKYFKYAVIRKTDKQDKTQVEKIAGELVLYKDRLDSTGHTLWIIKKMS